MGPRLGSLASSIGVGVATALVIVGIAILPFLTPAWVATGQSLTGADRLSGYTLAELEAIDRALLADLIVGPPAFDVEIGGEPVLAERERVHLADVRTVFAGFFVAVLASAVVLVAAFRLTVARATFWRRVGRGGAAVIVAVVAGALVAVTAFDTAFEIFHRLLFPPGSYSFDPATERLVQIFPMAFWSLTTIALGIVIVALAAATVALAAWRARVAGRRSTAPSTGEGGAAAEPSMAAEAAPREASR